LAIANSGRATCTAICVISSLPAAAGNLRLKFLLLDSTHQRNKPAAAGNFEFAEDRVEVLFHHRQT